MEAITKNILITAHAGCMGTAADSIESVAKGLEEGTDVIEVDVRFTNDQVPVLSHNRFSKSGISSLVKLEEVFVLIKESEHVVLNKDLKEYDAQCLSALNEIIVRTNMKDKIFFSGIQEENTEKIKRHCPECAYLLNYMPVNHQMENMHDAQTLLTFVNRSGAFGINLEKHFVTQEIVEIFHKNGKIVSVWTVDEKEFMEKMIGLGVDSITTRNVELLKSLLRCFP